MTWTKIDDDFTDRPAYVGCSRSARLLLVELYVWANRLGTNGEIPLAAMRRLTDAEDVDAEVRELVEAGLLEETDGGLQLDWADQLSSDEVDRRKAKSAERQRRSRLHRAGDHKDCDPRYCHILKAESGTVTRDNTGDSLSESHSESRSPVPPVRPSRPKGKGRAERATCAQHPEHQAATCAVCHSEAKGSDPRRPAAFIGKVWEPDELRVSA